MGSPDALAQPGDLPSSHLPLKQDFREDFDFQIRRVAGQLIVCWLWKIHIDKLKDSKEHKLRFRDRPSALVDVSAHLLRIYCSSLNLLCRLGQIEIECAFATRILIRSVYGCKLQ